jgi:biotin-dependent carboxylase-like uncharacterized protein
MSSKVIRIREPGPLAAVQDRGRYGYQEMGVPVSGAMDQWALRLGNLLVGNAEDAAAIEITLGGFAAEFLADTVCAVAGLPDRATLNQKPVPSWRPLAVARGDVLALERGPRGARDYLFLAGGVDVPVALGSRSTYLRGGFGGLEGRALRPGDELAAGPPSGRMVDRLPPEFLPCYPESPVLRVVLGPQDDRFTEEGLSTFLSGTYEVTTRADRMGYRLEGPAIRHRKGADIISDGIPLGAVQVPGDGQPVVLLADRPTTGGYAKIGTIISVDVPLIAQALPGARVRFQAISVEEAREIYLRREYSLKRFLERQQGSSG